MDKNKAIIVGLSNSNEIAKNVSRKLGIELCEFESINFSDGEMNFKIKSSVRNKSVYIFQSTVINYSNGGSINDSIIELALFTDALKRSSANEINIIIPYFGYARQDRRTELRQPISARLVEKLLEISGATRVITCDLHSPQIEGFFDIPLDNLKVHGIIARKISETFDLKKEKHILVSPDYGSVTRTKEVADILGTEMAIINKKRISTNKVESISILGNVEGKNCIIYDDLIDTGGTILSAIKLLKINKAKNIYLVSTHSVLSKINYSSEIIDKFFNSGISKFITTNTISRNFKGSKNADNIEVIDLSPVFSKIIKLSLEDKSISKYFFKEFSTIL